MFDLVDQHCLLRGDIYIEREAADELFTSCSLANESSAYYGRGDRAQIPIDITVSTCAVAEKVRMHCKAQSAFVTLTQKQVSASDSLYMTRQSRPRGQCC